jgi:GNAT superfamily N-acetyltransferase
VRSVAIDDRDGVRGFIRLERELRAGDALFVPEIEKDVAKFLMGRSAFNLGIEHALFVASNGGDVARCAAFVNQRWQERNREAVGSIGYFAAAPGVQREVNDLLARAEGWLAERGVTRVIAPFNGTVAMGMALRTSGHGEPPPFPFNWHPPYYADYIDSAGYRPTYPWWSYDIDFSSEAYRKASQRALDHAACVIRPIDKKRWNEEVETCTRLMNDVFRDEWEFTEGTPEELHEFLDPLKALMDPRQLLFAEVDGEAIGICFGTPNWNTVIRRLRGKMGPVGLVRFFAAARRVREAGLFLIGVREPFRGRHIGHTLAATLYRRYEELGLAGSSYYTVNESNVASRALAVSLGGEGRVDYHNFDKELR